MMRYGVIGLVILFVLGLTAVGGAKVIFYAPYDGSADAQIAGGNKAATLTGTITYDTGKMKQGILIDGTDACSYATAGNFNKDQGSLLMWVKRGANSDAFFTIGDTWYGNNFFTFRMVESQKNMHTAIKDAAGNFVGRFDTNDIVPAVEWHHHAITWNKSEVKYYIDGVQKASAAGTGVMGAVAATMYVGSSAGKIYQANSVIDELRIDDEVLLIDKVKEAMSAVPSAVISQDKLTTTWSSIKTKN